MPMYDTLLLIRCHILSYDTTLLTRQTSKGSVFESNSSFKQTLNKKGVLYNLNGKRLVATNEKPAAKKSLIVIC